MLTRDWSDGFHLDLDFNPRRQARRRIRKSVIAISAKRRSANVTKNGLATAATRNGHLSWATNWRFGFESRLRRIFSFKYCFSGAFLIYVYKPTYIHVTIWESKKWFPPLVKFFEWFSEFCRCRCWLICHRQITCSLLRLHLYYSDFSADDAILAEFSSELEKHRGSDQWTHWPL
jgi:hypothetical protein